jgi:hypothetical protein
MLYNRYAFSCCDLEKVSRDDVVLMFRLDNKWLFSEGAIDDCLDINQKLDKLLTSITPS